MEVNEAIEKLSCIYMEVSTDSDREAIDMAIEALKEQRPHGLWVEGVIGYHYCSECHNYALADDDLADDDGKEVLSNFCPNCGADMRKEGDEE